MRPLILVPTINSRHLERMLLTAVVCTEMPAPPTGRALLLGGGSAMTLEGQGGYRAMCGRSWGGTFVARRRRLDAAEIGDQALTGRTSLL